MYYNGRLLEIVGWDWWSSRASPGMQRPDVASCPWLSNWRCGAGLGRVGGSFLACMPQLGSILLPDYQSCETLFFYPLQDLPQAVLQGLQDPASQFNLGWSHGKERLKNGQLDTHKGSFYANPVLDVPTEDVELQKRHPAYCR